ncbi:MAG TPA: polysaccharide biosynthesis tyrosine autokinase, partial [Flavisolibacter sp.]|nr:polysaccharide biosynthesis tyrosine autokinase [Flavisolibacter sp.]
MNEHQPIKEQAESNQIGQIIQKFLPYWPLFVISVALSLAVAYVKLRAEQPMFVAYGKILLKDPNKSDSKVLDAFNITGEKKVIENEILVLRSASVLQEVVRRLHISVTVCNEGRVRIEELYKENSPVWFVATTNNKDSIYEAGKYYFKVNWAKSEVEIDNKRVGFNQEVIIGNTAYKVVPNPIYNKHVTGKNFYANFSSVRNAAGSLIGAIGANPISASSSVIDVKITTPVPDKGIDVLTTLFNVYNEYAVLDKKQAAENTLAFIDERLAKVESQLDSVEQGVVDYKAQNSIYDLQAQASNYFSQTTQLDQSKSEIDLQLKVLGSVKNYVTTRGDNNGMVPSLGAVSDPTLSGLVQKLYDAESELRQLRAVDGEKSDAVIAAKDQVAKLKSEINESIDNVRKTLATTKNSYSGLQNKNASMLRSNPQKEKAFAIISRQAGIKNSIYTYLLTKKEETALNSASTITDLRVLESPNAYGPVSPVPKSFYTSGLMVGLIIPGVFVFLKEMLNRRVQLKSEIEQKTTAPVVAEIAQVTSDSPIVIRDGKRTIVAEQFRSLRTNLTFMGLNEKTNTILVTSSMSGEGKSFTAINLAVSFTLIGKKVALLELDLRKPKISKLLQLINDVGISNYLVGQATITDIIKPTEIKDLFVLPSGIIPPNPAELIQKERFRQLMTEVKSRFDYVIIDTAPVGPVADAFLLNEYTDATVFMVRQNKT